MEGVKINTRWEHGRQDLRHGELVVFRGIRKSYGPDRNNRHRHMSRNI